MNPLLCHLIMLGIAASANWDYVTINDFYDRIELAVRAGDNISKEELEAIVDEFELYDKSNDCTQLTTDQV